MELTEILAPGRVAHNVFGICDSMGDRVVMDAILLVEHIELDMAIG